jgi:hypothetical protein
MKLQRALANCGPSFPLIQAGLGVYLIFSLVAILSGLSSSDGQDKGYRLGLRRSV